MSDISRKYNELANLNRCIKGCKRCRLSSTRIHAVCGEGDVHARLFFIAQAPGGREDQAGKMFVGPTGTVLDEFFHEVGLKREEVYMTNLIKCRLPKNRKPQREEIELCSKYLEQEIEIIKPEFLIPLGYHATKYIVRRYCGENAPSSDLIGKLIYGDGRKIYPLRHPSAVLHNPSLKQTMTQDFKRIAIFKNPCRWYPVCPMKKYVEAGRLDPKWIELFCKGDWESCRRYQIEEEGRYHPDNMLPDGSMKNQSG